MTLPASPPPSMPSGWGLVCDFRGDGPDREALTLFDNEEAPRWINYRQLMAYRRHHGYAPASWVASILPALSEPSDGTTP